MKKDKRHTNKQLVYLFNIEDKPTTHLQNNTLLQHLVAVSTLM